MRADDQTWCGLRPNPEGRLVNNLIARPERGMPLPVPGADPPRVRNLSISTALYCHGLPRTSTIKTCRHGVAVGANSRSGELRTMARFTPACVVLALAHRVVLMSQWISGVVLCTVVGPTGIEPATASS